MNAGERAFSLTVEPEPTPEEAEALTAALAVYLTQLDQNAPRPPALPASRWAMAGRIAAHADRAGFDRERHGWRSNDR